MDTVARVLKRLPPEYLLYCQTVAPRNRRLSGEMVPRHSLVAVDGTLQLSAAYSCGPNLSFLTGFGVRQSSGNFLVDRGTARADARQFYLDG